MNKTLISAMILGGMTLAGTAFAHGGDKFKTMDTNNDGQISSAEHAAGVATMFSGMDADKDGFVTSTEMDSYHMGMKSGSHAGMKMSAADKIKAMDTDGDGKLSSAEHDTGAQSMFTKMDADASGSLSKNEMDAGRDKAEAAKDKAAKDKSAMHDHGTTDAGSGSDTTTPPAGGN